MTIVRDEPEPPELSLSTAALAAIALKAKAFDMLVASDDPTDGSNASDDRFLDALEDERDNPAGRELRAAIASLDVDAQAELVALVWTGRGDYDADDWAEALEAARSRHEAATWRYLTGIPLLGDYIEDGADKLGLSLADDESEAMSDPVSSDEAEAQSIARGANGADRGA